MKQPLFTTLLLIIIYLAFISLGLPDTVLGIAWPYMRIDFGKPLEVAGYLSIFGTICTALSSIMSGHILARFGTGRVTFVSCMMTALGLLGYSLAPSFYWLFLFLPLLGFGAGCIDCGLNIFVAANYSSRHMNWLHCCWGIGATFGPMIMTSLLASGYTWRAGYRTIGFIQLGLSVILFASIGLWAIVQNSKKIPATETASIRDGEESTVREDDSPESVARRDALRKKAIRIQIAIYAIYASCEFLVGLWTYSLLVRERGMNPTVAGLWVSFYYAALTGSRFVTGFIVDRLGNRFMIKAGLVTALVGVCLLSFRFFFPGANDLTALAGLILLGAGLGPVYPCMTHETPRRFRPSTAEKIVGYQTGAASLGGAAFPAIVGYVGAHTSLEILSFTEALLVGGTLALMVTLDRMTAKEPI